MTTKELQLQERIDILSGMVQDLRRELDDARGRQEALEGDKIALQYWLDASARSIERLGALVEDIRIGAEQQSQSHADVIAKIKTFRGEV